MERIAIISDIHGNIPALEAVLADIQQRGIQKIYCLGDLVGKGPEPERAVDLCREVCAGIVRGNWDCLISDTHYRHNEHALWQREKLGQERMDWLMELPNTIDLSMKGGWVRLYHASHVSEWHRIYAYVPYDTHLSMFTNTPFTSEDAPEPDVVGYGDIHMSYQRRLHQHNKLLFNTGSVGNPLDLPQASYAILTDGDDVGRFLLDIVRLPYDIEEAVRRTEQIDMPEARPYIQELRTAIYRGHAG